MKSKRTIFLMFSLLLLLLGYVYRPYWEPLLTPAPAYRPPSPLLGVNTISSLKVHRDGGGRWLAGFDYFYTGDPGNALVQLYVSPEFIGATESATAKQSVSWLSAAKGQHHAEVELQRPAIGGGPYETRQVIVELGNRVKLAASQRVAQIIEWPEWRTWSLEQELAGRKVEEVLARAVSLIDAGDRRSLDDAKAVLERLISKDPQFDPGYVELARVAMKSNWGPEGLHQAENLLSSALSIQPGNVDAKILLGYVYAHQRRYKAAETLLAESERSNPKNLWLWSNWGELLTMEGKTDAAIEKYRRALAAPPSSDAYDLARRDAYQHLLKLLEQKRDLEGMDALHKKRVEEYGQASCYGSDYARFVLDRGDTERAISLARFAIQGRCVEAATRVLGLAQYVAWSRAPEPRRGQLLNEARIHMPAGPKLFLDLASSELTMAAAKLLVAAGESVDQRDNQQFDALAYAVQERQYARARRLLSLGAHAERTVGPVAIPVALIPVLSGDVEGVRLMRKSGVDYTKLRYQGTTGADLARQLGDRRIVDAIDQAGRL